MTKRNHDSAKRPNTPDQIHSPNKQLKDVCELMIYFAVAATLIAWAMDHPGAICWAFRIVGPLFSLLAIGLRPNAPRRITPSPAPEPRPHGEPTGPRGIKDWIGIGVAVLAGTVMTVVSPIIIAEGIRAMVTQTMMSSTKYSRTPVPLTGGMAVLGGAVMVIVGSLGLIPSLLVIHTLWKKYFAKQSNRHDERNS